MKLEIQLPMLHNELIEARLSSVKISNIFIDTSDGANLFAQFEITSTDHFTKHFTLSLRGCELLLLLNISHSLLLPLNRSTTVLRQTQTGKVRRYAGGLNENLMTM
jgi:hypothetical protein